MSARPHLAVVDETTGEVIPAGRDRRTHELELRVRALEEDVQNEQEENARLRRVVKALRKDRENERQRHRRRQEVEGIWADWQAVTGQGRRKLSAERFDVIVARLNEGYEAEHFRLAAVGCEHANPWTVKQGQEPLREVATIASRGTWLEQFCNAGARWEKSRRAG